MIRSLLIPFLVLGILQSSCDFIQEPSTLNEIGKAEMIRIARTRDCSKIFPGVYVFDVCISRIQAKFDDLLLQDKKEVVLNFLMYQNLEAGPGIVFSELIYPCEADILAYLNNLSDGQLKSTLSMKIWDWWKIVRYRSRVDRLRGYPRNSNGTGLPDAECNSD
jgi:hypothetical protein